MLTVDKGGAVKKDQPDNNGDSKTNRKTLLGSLGPGLSTFELGPGRFSPLSRGERPIIAWWLKWDQFQSGSFLKNYWVHFVNRHPQKQPQRNPQFPPSGWTPRLLMRTVKPASFQSSEMATSHLKWLRNNDSYGSLFQTGQVNIYQALTIMKSTHEHPWISPENPPWLRDHTHTHEKFRPWTKNHEKITKLDFMSKLMNISWNSLRNSVSWLNSWTFHETFLDSLLMSIFHEIVHQRPTKKKKKTFQGFGSGLQLTRKELKSCALPLVDSCNQDRKVMSKTFFIRGTFESII